MDAIDQLGELSKGEARGGKYFRRVATGNPKRPWRYFYTREAYEKEHGDKAHRNGEEEKARREAPRHLLTVRGEEGMEARMHQLPDTRLSVMLHDADAKKLVGGKIFPGTMRKEAEAYAKKLVGVDGVPQRSNKSMDAIDQLKQLTKSDDPKPFKGRRVQAPKPVNALGERAPQISPTMVKGLGSFQEPYGEGKKLTTIPDAWLPDYVDSFLEEAYEHERQETAHRDPNLIEPGTDPADALVAAIYNEFVAYCAQNKNLMRAKTSIPVTKEYVMARLNELGHIHVNTENHNAEIRGAVAGYYPTRLALSENAEMERAEMIHHMGTLAKSDDHVALRDDGENPMNALAGAMEHHAQSFHGTFGAESPVGAHDGTCPFHGRDLHKSGIEAAAIHGVVCTCK